MPAVRELVGRLYLRPEDSVRGIFISANGFTEPAVELARQTASKRVLILCNLAEIVQALEREECLGRFFKDRADHAVLELRGTA